MSGKASELLHKPPVMVNIGVRSFAEGLSMQQAEFLNVDWSPPAGGDEKMNDLLDAIL